MWELDHKACAPKNWCFQTVVLEKTLGSPLDSKKIKPVNPKGNQPWLFIGRTDAEAVILWSPDVKSQLIGKDPDVGKVMSLFFKMLSRLTIAFLPRSKCLLISWLQSPSTVILKPRKIKSVIVSTVFPSICHEVMGPDAMILVFRWVLSQLFHCSLSSSRGSLYTLHFLP